MGFGLVSLILGDEDGENGPGWDAEEEDAKGLDWVGEEWGSTLLSLRSLARLGLLTGLLVLPGFGNWGVGDLAVVVAVVVDDVGATDSGIGSIGID